MGGDGNILSASKRERLECSLIYQAEPEGRHMLFLKKIPSSSFDQNIYMIKKAKNISELNIFLSCFFYFSVSFGLVHI